MPNPSDNYDLSEFIKHLENVYEGRAQDAEGGSGGKHLGRVYRFQNVEIGPHIYRHPTQNRAVMDYQSVSGTLPGHPNNPLLHIQQQLTDLSPSLLDQIDRAAKEKELRASQLPPRGSFFPGKLFVDQLGDGTSYTHSSEFDPVEARINKANLEESLKKMDWSKSLIRRYLMDENVHPDLRRYPVEEGVDWRYAMDRVQGAEDMAIARLGPIADKVEFLDNAGKRQRQIGDLRMVDRGVDFLASEVEDVSQEAIKRFGDEHPTLDDDNRRIHGRPALLAYLKEKLPTIERLDKHLARFGLASREWLGKAGHALSVTPYDEVKSVINAARTGGVVDEDGNFPSPEEIRETKVNEEYGSVLKYLSQTEKEADAAKIELQEARKERERNLARAEKEILAAKKEDKVRTRLEINNEKLMRVNIDY